MSFFVTQVNNAFLQGSAERQTRMLKCDLFEKPCQGIPDTIPVRTKSELCPLFIITDISIHTALKVVEKPFYRDA